MSLWYPCRLHGFAVPNTVTVTVLPAPPSQAEEMLGSTPEEVATFLAKTEGLDKTLIGDYLGEREDFNLKVMHAFVDALDFSALEFDTAIRTFLQVSFCGSVFEKGLGPQSRLWTGPGQGRAGHGLAWPG
jgi:hypothetical protein